MSLEGFSLCLQTCDGPELGEPEGIAQEGREVAVQNHGCITGP